MYVPRLTPQFHASLRHASLGPDSQRALRSCIRQLTNESDLPGPADLRVRVPPVGIEEWARRVPGTGNSIWLYYRLIGNELRLMRVSRNQPVRAIDDD